MTHHSPTRTAPQRLDPAKVTYWKRRLEQAEWSASLWARLVRQEEKDLDRCAHPLDEREVASRHEHAQVCRRHLDRALDGIHYARTMLNRHGVAFAEDWANGDTTRWEAVEGVHKTEQSGQAVGRDGVSRSGTRPTGRRPATTSHQVQTARPFDRPD